MKFYCSYPPGGEKNPFFLLLSKHLISNDWAQKTFNFKIYNLFRFRKEVKILWFHWPNSHWRSKFFLIKFIKIIRFFIYIYLASFLGYKLIWSAHNVLPHSHFNSKLELLLRRIFVRKQDLVIGHAKNTYRMLINKGIFAKKYILALHGNYEDYYNSFDLKINRTSLGFSEKDIILLLNSGGKNYKDALVFIKIFLKNKYTNIKLLVYGKDIMSQIDVVNHNDIKFVGGFLSNEKISSFMQLCNYVVLPYRQITTSGAFFLSITFDKPVIAQNIDFFLQHVTDDTAVLYNSDEELIFKLKQIDSSLLKINSNNLSELKKKYSWHKSSKIIAREFNQLISY